MKWAILVTLYQTLHVIQTRLSEEQIKELSEFLDETSKLDNNVRGIIPADDEAWEKSGKFEGDMVLNDVQKRTILAAANKASTRAGSSDVSKRWPGSVVVYAIKPKDFSLDQVAAITKAMAYISTVSCVKFQPSTKEDKNYVLIKGDGPGCFSHVGYIQKLQILNFTNKHPIGKGCFRLGTLLHEMLHTLGFYHMHSSTNRDDHITIKWENVIPGKEKNFLKYDISVITDLHFGYDYRSIMHYGPKVFSKNGLDTIIPTKANAKIGQRQEMSLLDIERLNVAYCDVISKFTTKVPLTE